MKKRTISLAGGLGNQLFQYAYALFDSDLNMTEFDGKLGGAVYNKEGLPELFDFNLFGEVKLIEGENPGSIRLRIVRLMRQASSTSKRWVNSPLLFPARFVARILICIYLKENRKLFLADGTGYFDKIDLNPRSFVIGYFHSYKWASQEEVYSKLKQLRLKLPSTEIEVFRDLASKESPLVVHVRLGDYENQEGFGIPSKNYYIQSISKLWESGQYKKIWIFTNDQTKARHLIPSNYSSFIRWIPNVSNSSAETLEVMRFGLGYVIGNSTYSWWGAFLSYSSEPEVIAPNPWFRSAQSPRELIPPNWSTFEAWN
jgi:hypothetical protein